MTEPKTTLKAYFEDGDIPTGANFSTLIDSAALIYIAANETQRTSYLATALAGDWCYQTATDKMYFCDGSSWIEVATVIMLVDGYRPLTEKSQAIFTVEGSLTVGAGVIRIRNRTGRTLTISEVHCEVNTAPVGAAIIVDVHKAGVTIFTTQSNRPEIADGANVGSSTTIEVPVWANDTYLTIDRDQVGSTTPGSDLVVTVVYS